MRISSEPVTPPVVKAAARGDVSFVAAPMKQLIHETGLELNEASPAYQRLAYELLRTEAGFESRPYGTRVGHAVQTPAHTHSDLTLDKLVDYWAVQTKAKTNTDGSVFNEFKQQHPGLMAYAVRKTHVVQFRDSLLNKGLSAKTVDKKLNFLRTVFEIALDSDTIKLNPITSV